MLRGVSNTLTRADSRTNPMVKNVPSEFHCDMRFSLRVPITITTRTALRSTTRRSEPGHGKYKTVLRSFTRETAMHSSALQTSEQDGTGGTEHVNASVRKQRDGKLLTSTC
jgi:hypothetical protein